MFIELMPILAKRTIVITLSRVDENTIRANVIPKKIEAAKGGGEADDNALTTPLCVTGSAEELDAELPRQLASYAECHARVGSTLAEAKAEMDAAAKAAQEEARKKREAKGKKEPASPEPASPPPAAAPPSPTLSLFDSPAAGNDAAEQTQTAERTEDTTTTVGSQSS